MRSFYGLFFGLAVGGAIGSIFDRLLVTWAASFASILFAVLIAGWATFLFMWSHAKRAGHNGVYFGFGSENLALVARLCIIGMVVHLAIGWLAAAWPTLIDGRPLVLGAVSGAYGALSSVWAMTAIRRMRVR